MYVAKHEHVEFHAIERLELIVILVNESDSETITTTTEYANFRQHQSNGVKRV